MIRFLLIAAVSALSAATPALGKDAACDRDCLKGIVDTYLAAMAKHDPKAAPLSGKLVMTENRKPITTSEGLWSTLTAVPGTFQIYVPDVAEQQIGYMGILTEGDHPIQLGLRLKIENGKITEAEHEVVHRLTESGLANLQAPRGLIQREVPEPYRDSRERVAAIALGYYDALALDNGDLAHFADDCVRHENGMQTARGAVPGDWDDKGFSSYRAMGCDKQLDVKVMAYIDDVGHQRIMVVDEKTGLAMGYSHLRHKMARKTFPIVDVPWSDHRTVDYEPFDNIAMHIFKVWGGEIHEIEAMGFRDAYNADSAWDAPAPVAREAAPKAACDRDCLKGMVNRYLDAMLKHDPKAAPLAKSLVTVENLKRIKPGEGLWETLSGGPTRFQVYVPDVRSEQVGYIGVLDEGGTPVALGLRLKVEKGKIVEAEHVVVRNLTERALPNLQEPRANIPREVPAPYRDSHGRLLHIAASYYDALDDNNGDLAPFADDCVRRENGGQSARNPVPSDMTKGDFGYLGALGCEAQIDTQAFTYIDTIGNRRVWIADEDTGLAFGLSHFHHSMTQHVFRVIGVPGMETRNVDANPFDMPAVHVFKIWGGQIHEIEALGIVAPYNSPTGWEDKE